MAIKGEGCIDAFASHQVEAHAVHQTEITFISRQQERDPSLVLWGVDPPDPQRRNDVVVQQLDDLKSQAMSDECERLLNNVATRKENLALFHNALPRRRRTRVAFIGPIDDGVETGCVYEDRHDP